MRPLLVLPQGLFELVLQDDDAAGGLHGGALVDHLAGPGGQAQLVAGVAAVSAGRALRGRSVSLRPGCAGSPARRRYLRGPAHRVGGVVLVAEHVIGCLGPLPPPCRGPRRRSAGAQGYGLNTIYRRMRRLVMSAPAARDGLGCEDRVSVTGDHLSFDGTCGVRPTRHRPMAGDPTGVRALPFLYFLCVPCCPPARRDHFIGRRRGRTSRARPSRYTGNSSASLLDLCSRLHRHYPRHMRMSSTVTIDFLSNRHPVGLALSRGAREGHAVGPRTRRRIHGMPLEDRVGGERRRDARPAPSAPLGTASGPSRRRDAARPRR